MLKNTGKTLSITESGEDLLSISQWTEIINEEGQNSDYVLYMAKQGEKNHEKLWYLQLNLNI